MLDLFLFVLIVIVDQITKYLTELYIPFQSSVPVWKDVLELANVHNTGAAWGMFAGGRWIFIILTLVVCAFIVYFLRKEKRRLSKLARYALVLIVAGAVGNLIDRAFLGYVRDMISVVLIHFPVFNVADSSVTIGAALLIIDTIRNDENSFFRLLGLDEKKSDGNPEEE